MKIREEKGRQEEEKEGNEEKRGEERMVRQEKERKTENRNRNRTGDTLLAYVIMYDYPAGKRNVDHLAKTAKP